MQYAAVYRDARGRIRHAGTFATRKQANRAWQHAEALMAAGRPGDPTSGRVTFADYVNTQWFPHHVIEPSTRESYRYCLDRHIVSWFGPMKMADILPIHVRQWVTELISAGQSPREHPAPEDRPVRGVHHGAQRLRRRPAPLARRQDSDRAGEGVPDPDAR